MISSNKLPQLSSVSTNATILLIKIFHFHLQCVIAADGGCLFINRHERICPCKMPVSFSTLWNGSISVYLCAAPYFRAVDVNVLVQFRSTGKKVPYSFANFMLFFKFQFLLYFLLFLSNIIRRCTSRLLW